MIFIGDIHGNLRNRFSQFLTILQQTSYQDDVLIQVGDLGLGYHSLEWEREALEPYNEWLASRNLMMYAIRGNHDDPSRFEDDPFQFSHLKLIKDWTVLEVQGKRVLCVGGAISIDRLQSKEGKNWWRGENFPEVLPEDDLLKDLDIVCTHTCPSFTWPQEFNEIVYRYAAVDPTLLEDLVYERRLVDGLFHRIQKVNDNKPLIWMYGHMHGDQKTEYGNNSFQCCDICKFYEV